MRFVSFDGTEIAYDVEGDGGSVLLLHGFASNGYINWIRSGVTTALADAGFRAIVPDQRGHGGSGRPHEPEAYADGAMVKDAAALLDHLEVERVDVVGYSMGSFVTMHLAATDPRVRAVVLGGVGANSLRMPQDRSPIADALLADDKSAITDPTAKSFRDFADLTGADRKALAAIQLTPRASIDAVASISVPALVLGGDNDPLAGPPEGLAERIPGAKAVTVGGSHLNIPNNPQFHRAIVDFLKGL